MAGLACIDSSALLELVSRERETPALEADLAARDGLIVSRLAVVECRRTVRRAGRARMLQTADAVLETVYLLDVTSAILDEAARIGPPLLRSLGAIHLASNRQHRDR